MSVVERAHIVDDGDKLLGRVEAMRRHYAELLDAQARARLGQFFTPADVARFVASMLKLRRNEIRLLDPGAGVGALTAATVDELARRNRHPARLTVTAYEIESRFLDDLRRTLDQCAALCDRLGISFVSQVVERDFLASAEDSLDHRCVDPDGLRFNTAVLNPPYRKIGANSRARRSARAIGVEVPNLYAAFVAGAIHALDRDGELAAIIPRSFCNGTYFRDFRRHLLSTMSLRQFHVFDSRDRAFGDDGVLQENVVVAGTRSSSAPTDIILSRSHEPGADVQQKRVEFTSVVHCDDPECFIRFADDAEVANRLRGLPAQLSDLGVRVSTGRVVDFRARQHLRQQPGDSTVPLIYPSHFVPGLVKWPSENGKKPNAIVASSETAGLLVPAGNYVLVRRFSAKEERRRVVAVVFEQSRCSSPIVGFENHLNYFHRDGVGLELLTARGLALFLNSTAVDSYLRQFSGHTQVNASDLRSLRYPNLDELQAAGQRVRNEDFSEQPRIDGIADELFFHVSNAQRA